MDDDIRFRLDHGIADRFDAGHVHRDHRAAGPLRGEHVLLIVAAGQHYIMAVLYREGEVLAEEPGAAGDEDALAQQASNPFECRLCGLDKGANANKKRHRTRAGGGDGGIRTLGTGIPRTAG